MLDLLLSIGLWTIFWMAGLATFSFFLIQPLIVLRFGIPTTLYLRKQGVLEPGNSILRQLWLALLVQLGILLGLISLVVVVFPEYLLLFLIGGAFVTLLGIRSTGGNAGNVTNYIENYGYAFSMPESDVLMLITARLR